MKIREFRLQKGIFIYKMRISFTKVDFYLQNGSLGLQMGLSPCYSPDFISRLTLIHIKSKICQIYLTYSKQYDTMQWEVDKWQGT